MGFTARALLLLTNTIAMPTELYDIANTESVLRFLQRADVPSFVKDYIEDLAPFLHNWKENPLSLYHKVFDEHRKYREIGRHTNLTFAQIHSAILMFVHICGDDEITYRLLSALSQHPPVVAQLMGTVSQNDVPAGVDITDLQQASITAMGIPVRLYNQDLVVDKYQADFEMVGTKSTKVTSMEMKL